jgi:hypothetical protein
MTRHEKFLLIAILILLAIFAFVYFDMPYRQ